MFSKDSESRFKDMKVGYNQIELPRKKFKKQNNAAVILNVRYFLTIQRIDEKNCRSYPAATYIYIYICIYYYNNKTFQQFGCFFKPVTFKCLSIALHLCTWGYIKRFYTSNKDK